MQEVHKNVTPFKDFDDTTGQRDDVVLTTEQEFKQIAREVLDEQEDYNDWTHGIRDRLTKHKQLLGGKGAEFVLGWLFSEYDIPVRRVSDDDDDSFDFIAADGTTFELRTTSAESNSHPFRIQQRWLKDEDASPRECLAMSIDPDDDEVPDCVILAHYKMTEYGNIGVFFDGWQYTDEIITHADEHESWSCYEVPRNIINLPFRSLSELGESRN